MAVMTLFVLVLVACAEAQSTAHVPVVGVKTGINPITGQRPARININDLYARQDEQWDLYIQALQALQAVNETDELSYFQISGIHGLPFLPWNGVEQADGAPDAGFCPHGEVLFSTWHRPYTALFEQHLLSHAMTIANQYPASSLLAYQVAAQQLRLPFWDWALTSSLPVAATLSNVTVNSPRGQITIANPLYNYRYQTKPTGNGFGGTLAQAMETVRCPNPGSMSNNATASDDALGSMGTTLMAEVYDTFIRAADFPSMATMTIGAGNSFEAPHNVVHGMAGCGNGSLADINWSAFDPLFMLLHANLDRLVAMWQAVHYDAAMFNTTTSSGGQFATPAGTPITSDSPLKPFYDQDLQFWTSSKVAETRTFGYTYPGLDDWSLDAPTLARNVTSLVNQLYGGSVATSSVDASSSRRRHRAAPSKYYTAEISVDRAELTLPCSIHIVAQGRVLARTGLLAMPTAGVANMSVPLQRVLSPHMGLPDTRVDTVLGFVRRHVEVQIWQRDGTMTPASQVSSLRMDVQDLDMVPRTSDATLPTFGKATRWVVSLGSRRSSTG